jgi:hypothetical protein
MSWSQNVKPLPAKWGESISFKLMKPGERVGYIDTVPAKTGFKLVVPGQTPLNAFAPRMPFECQSIKDIHASNKLTMTIMMDKRVWESLNDLDTMFDKFIVENASKIFGPAEYDFILKNPSSIALKRPKRLAPYDACGNPIYDSRLSLRINGRTMEVEAVQTSEGPRGAYVSGVSWAPRTEALPASATRFSKVTGHTAPDFKGSSMPIVRDTMPIFSLGDARRAGSGHVRYIGPGDMASKCVVHHAVIRPAYWTNVGGGFMITLALDHVIFENVEGGAGGESDGHGGAHALPDGFMRDPHESGKPLEDTVAGAPPPAPKRRITVDSVAAAGGGPSPASLAAAEEWDIEPGQMPTRNITGGGSSSSSSIGSSSFRALSRSATGAAGAYDDEE